MSSNLEKCIIITGANTGLGYYCAKSIALENNNWHVVLACRDETKAKIAVAKLVSETGNPHISFLPLDLASFESVKRFVQLFVQSKFPPLKGIVCNAGIAGEDTATYTEDGIETTFQVNCLSHFLLIHLLNKHLILPSRILMLSSELHRSDGPMKSFLPNYINADKLAHPNKEAANIKGSGSTRYSTTKLCMLFYTHAFNEEWNKNGIQNRTINAFNPGLMPDTGLGGLNKKIVRKLFLKYVLPIFVKDAVSTPQKSGKCLADLMVSEKYEGISGKYFDRDHEAEPSKESFDKVKMNDLWQTSLKLTGLSSSIFNDFS